MGLPFLQQHLKINNSQTIFNDVRLSRQDISISQEPLRRPGNVFYVNIIAQGVPSDETVTVFQTALNKQTSRCAADSVVYARIELTYTANL